MSRLFCVVYVLDADFRLMPTSAGAPVTWRMNMNLDNETSQIQVHDIVEVENEIPKHVGLEIEVVTPGVDIDTALQSADRLASTVVSLLSAAARAYAPLLQPFVAYEITPEVTERPHVQWFRVPALPRGKTPVPEAVFGFLFQQLPMLKNERFAQRIRLSIDWHRAGLRETDALFRFVNLWTALEAIGNPLAEHYNVDVRGWHGLRKLAEDNGYQANIISEFLDIRRHLFHDLSISPAHIRPRAANATPIIELLLIAGWVRLLGSPEKAADFPTSSVTPYPMQYIVRGLILDEDASQWGNGTHPHFKGELVAQRVPATNPDSVTVTYMLNAQAQNFQQWSGGIIEVWGPSGPNIPKIESTSLAVRKADSDL